MRSEVGRFTTAAINAFVGPKVRRYIRHPEAAVATVGIGTDIHLMRSNGGVATSRAAVDLPATLLLSGPAAGVLGGEWVGRLAGRQRLITFDMGGTCADIGIVTEHGFVEASARDTKIGGYPVMVPMIDIKTIGAAAGVLYAGTMGAADPTSGLSFLLPSFAAAFLGATAILPGRFNPWGSLVAVYFLVTGITGLTLLGVESYVPNLFQGGALILAVVLSQLVRRRVRE